METNLQIWHYEINAAFLFKFVIITHSFLSLCKRIRMKAGSLWSVVLCVLALASCTRSETGEAAAAARQLVRDGTYGVLISINRAGKPFGKVTSYSDGGTGTPYFYLDPTGVFNFEDPRASFSLSEIELDGCDGKDPQSPLCAKITLSGKVVMVGEGSREEVFAKAALFNAHPQFAELRKENAVFKLIISSIFLVNKAARPPTITVGDYFAG